MDERFREAIAEMGGVDVSVIDAEAENLSPQQVAEKVSEICPDVVGLIVTGTNLSASTQKMSGAEATAEAIKQDQPLAKVFMWGLHPSALPERTIKECSIDYVVSGEGLDTIVALGRGQLVEVSQWRDLYYRDATGRIIYTGRGPLKETSELPMPAWDMLPMNLYLPHNWHIMGDTDPQSAKGRYGVISASIGCPYHCSFCAISAQFGKRVLRFWDVDRVINEIQRLVEQYGVKYIKMLDECFVLKKTYVKEFCEKLIARHYDLNIWCYARVDTVDQELLGLLRQAGIQWLAYGIESGDDAALAGVDKGQYTANQTRQAIRWTKEAGINTIANFMFGLPDDTMESMQKTLNLAREINPEWINFYVTMPYPGSDDYSELVKQGKIVEDSWIQYAQYSYECTPMGSKYLSPAEVLQFRDHAFNAFFENNDRYYDLIREKFGQQYVDSIQNMLKTHLRRELLGD